MTFFLFSKILREKLLDFKVKVGMKSVLKWWMKEKKNTKSQPKKIECETANFSSIKLTKPTKNF